MKFLAHIDNDLREQSVKDHLTGTAQFAGNFAEAFGCYEWGYCAGMLHDIGKYSLAFMKRLSGADIQVDHSTAGAKLCWDRKGMYQLLSYCIAGHHAGLPDTGESGDVSTSGTLMARLKKKIEDYSAFSQEIEIPPLTKAPFEISGDKDCTFICSVFIRMLFSCLVDADFLDTEYFMKQGNTQRESGESMDVLLHKLENHISLWLSNEDYATVNGRRTEILKSCLDKGEMERGLFRLTVPTGGGKTVASLAFALRHAVKNHMNHIIYVVPYTSIIEQNAKVFSKILGESNVLEDHCNVDYGSGEELKPMQLAAENWDKPVIVTTNVQFFESLFSRKTSKCRKLHNIANSIVIFDEAQMLPNDYLKPCVSVMEELLRHYRTSMVLCTATQPALQKIFSGEWNAEELCPRLNEQFCFFKRVTLRNLNVISEDELVERLRTEKRALCILNTKKKVQSVYQKLKGEGVYHLSTSMYPMHRRRVLERVGKRLDDKLKCIVISTSLVEAGVNLDFQSVYRQMAGVDSIIQAAGRCNREGESGAEESIVSIFQLEGKECAPGQKQQTAVTKQLLENNEDITSLDSISEYFEMLYHYQGEGLDKKNILGQFEKMRFPFARVNDEFKLIENNTKTIFINREERADQILSEIRCKGFSRSRMREAAQYCINVYDNDFQKLYAANMIMEVSEDMKEDFFVLRDKEQYTEEMGLLLNVEYGRAVFS